MPAPTPSEEESAVRFAFADPGQDLPWWSQLFGVRRATSWVALDGERLEARFGPWRVSTAIANVTAVRTTGPYSWWRIAGPARYGLSDRSLTFATRTDVGLEICFAEPVPGLDPWGRARHPSLTVTVADPDGLRRAILRRGGATDDPEG